MDTARVTSLNQMGVALSRAKERLIIIHGQAIKDKKRISCGYYPVLGNADTEQTSGPSVTINTGLSTLHVSTRCVPGDQEAVKARSAVAKRVVRDLAERGIVTPDPEGMPIDTAFTEADPSEVIHFASDFNYFAATEQARFLARGEWTKEQVVADTVNFASEVRFAQTTEDVSPIYGTCLPYMLQWERNGFCPEVETICHDGLLCFNPNFMYSDRQAGEEIMKRGCQDLTKRDKNIYRAAFEAAKVGPKDARLSGKVLIKMFSTRLHLTKKRVMDDGREIEFRVKAVEERVIDEIMSKHIVTVSACYKMLHKTAAQWAYIANAVMAFSSYHEKFKQIGTDPRSYDSWVDVSALEAGLKRLRALMVDVSTGETASQDDEDEEEDGEADGEEDGEEEEEEEEEDDDNVEGMYVEEPYFRNGFITAPFGKVCSSGHVLVQFQTPNSSFACDICNFTQVTNMQMYGCNLCNYDLCYSCTHQHF